MPPVPSRDSRCHSPSDVPSRSQATLLPTSESAILSPTIFARRGGPSSSELELYPLAGREDHESRAEKGGPLAAAIDDLVQLLVRVHRVVVEDGELLDTGLNRKIDRGGRAGMPPADLLR